MGINHLTSSRLRRLAVIGSLLVCSLVASTVALAGKPRFEQIRLRPADVALAKRTTLRASDVARGWMRRTPEKPTKELPTCPGINMDFSAFTITGRATSKFEQGSAGIDSQVEVFESRSDAARDFRKATTAPVVRCVSRWLRREIAKEAPGARVVSARLLLRPRVGEQAILYRVVLEVATPNGRVRAYVDLLGFQRGRTHVTLAFTNLSAPLGGQLAVARSVAARAR
jgi:hypothetical protein